MLLHNKKQALFLIATNKDNEAIGYGILFWRSRFPKHCKLNIPEISDLNVITEYQRNGVATKIIQYAEHEAQTRRLSALGICVEQSLNYWPAKQLYYKLGYINNGYFTFPGGLPVLVLKKTVKNKNMTGV